MPISEARPALLADALAIRRAQNDTAGRLQAALPEIEPWTLARTRGIIENSLLPRGTALIWAVDPVIGETGLAGFMLAKRYRSQPPEPDPTIIKLQLIGVRLGANETANRARLRYVTLSTFKAISHFAADNGMTWEGLFRPGMGFAIEDVLTEMEPRIPIERRLRVSDVVRNGVTFKLVQSAAVVPPYDETFWPDS